MHYHTSECSDTTCLSNRCVINLSGKKQICTQQWTFFFHIFTFNKSRPSPPVYTFFPISEFSYKLIRFLLYSSIVKSDNEIGNIDLVH